MPFDEEGIIDEELSVILNAKDDDKYEKPTLSSKIIESKLINLLSTLLPKRNSALDSRDNIFDLGGDSMMVIELVSKAKEEGINIGIKQVYDYPTVADLANNVAQEIMRTDTQYHSSFTTPEPISLLPNQIAYAFTGSMTIAIYLLRPTFLLEKEKLEAALQLLLQRHEVLRIRFANTGGEWQQVVNPYVSRPLIESIHLEKTLTDEQRARSIRDHYERLIKTIDVESEQVAVRAALFEWGHEQLFFFAIDHYSFDDMSMKLFWTELYLAYMGKLLPRIEMPYSVIVNNLYQLAKKWNYTEDQQFWMEQFAKIKHIPKSTNDSLKINEGIKAKIITLQSQQWVNKLLVDIPSNIGIQLHDVLLTAWVQTISKWGGLSGVVLILGSHNRELLNEMVHTMGCFVTAFPLYFEVPYEGEVKQAIDCIRKRIKQVPHKGMRYMLSMMVDPKWKEVIFSAAQPSLGFNYLGEEEIKQEMWQGFGADEIKSKLVSVSKGELLAGRHQATNGIPYLILHCQMNNELKSITLTCDYDSSHYDEVAVEQLLVSYEQKLQIFANKLSELQ